MPPLARPLIAAATAALAAITLAGCGLTPTAASAHLELKKDSAQVTALDPATGSLGGGDLVTITGEGLGAVTAVTFGGQPAGAVTVNGPTSVTAEVPPSIEWVSGAEVRVEVLTVWGAVAAASDLVYTYTAVTAIDRQLEYAFAHWDNYNLAAFGDFTTWGGDCINFVSQTLVARGWGTTPDWFNNAQEDWAAAFVHVPSFDEWLSARPEYGATRLTMAQSAEVKIGDIVMFDWDGDGSLDHAQVVSRVIRDQILMVGHDLNSTHRSIDLALAQQGTPAAQVFFWSIPAA